MKPVAAKLRRLCEPLEETQVSPISRLRSTGRETQVSEIIFH